MKKDSFFGTKQALAFALVTLFASPVFAQLRTWNRASDITSGSRGLLVGTVTLVESSRYAFTIIPDRETSSSAVRVTTDNLVTQYSGFAESGRRDIYTGNQGFSRLREGDRVEVRGVGTSSRGISADEVMLLGRGLGTSNSSAYDDRRVEGIVRALGTGNRITLETDRGERLTILGTESTPVYFEGQTYRIRNIEVGDRIRVEGETASGGFRARTIDVLQDVSGGGFGTGSGTTTSLSGRVTRIDTRGQTLRLETSSRSEVIVDTATARDRSGARFRVSDLQVGDRLEVTGQYDGRNTFRADTIRFATGDLDSNRYPTDVRAGTDPEADFEDVFETVVLYGTVAETVDENRLLIRDSSTNRTFSVFVDEEMVIRTKAGTYTTADRLKEGDRVVLRTFRDTRGRHVAQTIRLR